MFRHLLKLVWNRKRANFLIMLEMMVSFLVVFAVSLLALSWAENYRHPLGFEYRNVWSVAVHFQGAHDRGSQPSDDKIAVTQRQLLQAARELPEVEAAAGMSHAPYSGSQNGGGFTFNQRYLECEFATASDELPAVLGVTITRGRWFNDEDTSSNYRAVVINEQMARAAWSDADPVGKVLEEADNAAAARKPRRVVGIVSEFRLQGEFETPKAFIFDRRDPDGAPSTLLLRVRPGTTATFEEKLLRRLQATARDAAFKIDPLETMRATDTKIRTIPLIVFGLITGFLMLMVALGLLGVLYQNVTQRTREIGLRRALGAPAHAIKRQILFELLLMTSLGVAAGVLIVVQVPLLDLLAFLKVKAFAASLGLALVVIYSLTIACGLYPSWLATRVPPAEALHYE